MSIAASRGWKACVSALPVHHSPHAMWTGSVARTVFTCAPWCDHCRAVADATGPPRERAVLDGLEHAVVNIGKGEELDALRLRLGARAIPYWTVVCPRGCQHVDSWPRVASVNPKPDPAALAVWLEQALRLEGRRDLHSGAGSV